MSYHTFRRLDKHHRSGLPENTCPDIDSVIDILEELRKANTELRAAAEYWKDQCETVADERDQLELDLDDARHRISELETEMAAKP